MLFIYKGYLIIKLILNYCQSEDDKWMLIELLFRAKNTIAKSNTKYKLKLLYNANVDGYDCNIFHNKCDHHSPTITIIHSNFDHIFGGFTKVPLSNKHQNSYYHDENAFLFLIRSNPSKNDKPEIFEINKLKMDKAIKYDNKFGATFGWGSDIMIECYKKLFIFKK